MDHHNAGITRAFRRKIPNEGSAVSPNFDVVASTAVVDLRGTRFASKVVGIGVQFACGTVIDYPFQQFADALDGTL